MQAYVENTKEVYSIKLIWNLKIDYENKKFLEILRDLYLGLLQGRGELSTDSRPLFLTFQMLVIRNATKGFSPCDVTLPGPSISTQRKCIQSNMSFNSALRLSKFWLIGSRTCAFDWHQDRWDWMTLTCYIFAFSRNSYKSMIKTDPGSLGTADCRAMLSIDILNSCSCPLYQTSVQKGTLYQCYITPFALLPLRANTCTTDRDFKTPALYRA